MISKLEIHHLRTLDALFKCGSLSAAAEFLGVSQQAVSSQLRKIRDIMSDPLFIRSGHGVTPTPYAMEIEPHIRGVLTLLNDIPLPDTLHPNTLERTLVISATDYTQKVIVGELINELREYAPRVKVMVVNIESANLSRKMRQGEIDLAFTSEGYVPEGLISEALFVEQYRCVAASPLAQTSEPLSVEHLATHDFIVTSPGIGSFKGSADAWFERQGYQRNVCVSVPSFYTALDYVKRSNLVGFIPSRLLPYEGVTETPLEKYPPGYEVVAAYHPRATEDALLRWVLEHVKKRFTQ